MLAIIALMATDLPLPVAPATSRWHAAEVAYHRAAGGVLAERQCHR
jgi:hypothetical protein